MPGMPLLAMAVFYSIDAWKKKQIDAWRWLGVVDDHHLGLGENPIGYRLLDTIKCKKSG